MSQHVSGHTTPSDAAQQHTLATAREGAPNHGHLAMIAMGHADRERRLQRTRDAPPEGDEGTGGSSHERAA